MGTNRKSRDKRRNLNTDEMHDMGFVELQEHATEDGWAYPDDDDDETTERHLSGISIDAIRNAMNRNVRP